MKLEELQRRWQAVKSKPKSHEELRSMMYSSPAWRLDGLTRKEVLALCGNMLVLVAIGLAFGFFDGWDTALASSCGIVLLLDEYLGLRYMRLLPKKDTLEKTLINALTRIKQLALVSQIVHFLAWTALVLLLGTKVRVGTMNVILWALMLSPLLVAAFRWNSRKWSKKNDEVKAMLKEFGKESGMPAV